MRQLAHPSAKEMPLTEVLSALGDPVRLSIVNTLSKKKGEVPWSEFNFHIGKATLSHHMKTLRLAGIIHHRKEGTRCFVSLRPELEKLYPGVLKAILKSAPTES